MSWSAPKSPQCWYGSSNSARISFQYKVPGETLAGTNETLSAGNRESQTTDGSAGVGATGGDPKVVAVGVGEFAGTVVLVEVGVTGRVAVGVFVKAGVKVGVLVGGAVVRVAVGAGALPLQSENTETVPAELFATKTVLLSTAMESPPLAP